jgi:hypothetical protein
MHEVSLGYTIQDYLSGQEIEATTYEDLRQAIVQMVVERKGYPKEHIQSKIQIRFNVEGKIFSRSVDLVIYSPSGEPLLIVLFCAGEVETFIRETVAAARLLPDTPAKLALVTDTNQALLLRVADAEVLEKNPYQAIPDWTRLQEISEQVPSYELTEKKRQAEERILYAFSELSCSCRDTVCYTGS